MEPCWIDGSQLVKVAPTIGKYLITRTHSLALHLRYLKHNQAMRDAAVAVITDIANHVILRQPRPLVLAAHSKRVLHCIYGDLDDDRFFVIDKNVVRRRTHFANMLESMVDVDMDGAWRHYCWVMA